jgi:hypothetical protein
VTPKLDSADGETRRLFEELARRTSSNPVRKW